MPSSTLNGPQEISVSYINHTIVSRCKAIIESDEILGSVSIVVSIPACHVGDLGSIPRRSDRKVFSKSWELTNVTLATSFFYADHPQVFVFWVLTEHLPQLAHECYADFFVHEQMTWNVITIILCRLCSTSCLHLAVGVSFHPFSESSSILQPKVWPGLYIILIISNSA